SRARVVTRGGAGERSDPPFARCYASAGAHPETSTTRRPGSGERQSHIAGVYHYILCSQAASSLLLRNIWEYDRPSARLLSIPPAQFAAPCDDPTARSSSRPPLLCTRFAFELSER